MTRYHATAALSRNSPDCSPGLRAPTALKYRDRSGWSRLPSEQGCGSRQSWFYSIDKRHQAVSPSSWNLHSGTVSLRLVLSGEPDAFRLSFSPHTVVAFFFWLSVRDQFRVSAKRWSPEAHNVFLSPPGRSNDGESRKRAWSLVLLLLLLLLIKMYSVYWDRSLYFLSIVPTELGIRERFSALLNVFLGWFLGWGRLQCEIGVCIAGTRRHTSVEFTPARALQAQNPRRLGAGSGRESRAQDRRLELQAALFHTLHSMLCDYIQGWCRLVSVNIA